MDAFGARDERAWGGRQSRVVLTSRRWRFLATMLCIARGMVTRKPDHQGEPGISRNTVAQGMPGSSGEPVVKTRVFSSHETAGAYLAPGIPCAL
jgi:hypothetical protein